MHQHGNGSGNTIQREYPQKENRCQSIIAETLVKVGSDYVLLWVAMESKYKQTLAPSISKERNMFVTE